MKEDDKKQKRKISFEFTGGDHVVRSYSLHTALIEAFDWDEAAAIKMFEKAFEALTDIYEYSEYDKTLIENNSDYLKLLRANIPDVTDMQFRAIHELIDFKVKEKLDKLMNAEKLN